MSEQTQLRVVWVKDCTCMARATSNAVRISQRFDPETMSYRLTATHYPMFSCDECGKPFKKESKP